VWFLLGAAAAASVLAVPLMRSRRRARPRTEAETFRVGITAAPRVDLVAKSIATELAVLASGVEGNAQLLCEAIGEPDKVARRAEQVWRAVRRLRSLSEKILSYTSTVAVTPTAVDVTDLLASVREELDSNGCCRIELEAARSLRALADVHALRDAIVYLVDHLFALAGGANKLTMRAEPAFTDNEDSLIAIELTVESDDGVEPPPAARVNVEIGRVAAQNLLAAMGADLSIERAQAGCATATITLRVAPPGPARAGAEPVRPRGRHAFGGILLLASDPSIRAMVAQELDTTGRQVFVCADAAAARALYQATPDRFELLILEAQDPQGPGEELAEQALRTSADVRVVLLGDRAPRSKRAAAKPNASVRTINKPFGIMELRAAVAEALGTFSAP
jgi:CheY-like chemotaxis protein